MEKEEIKNLLIGAYLQLPTYPGYYVKLDDFRAAADKVAEVYQWDNSQFDILLQEFFPEAKREERYIPRTEEEPFVAYRISPRLLKPIEPLRKLMKDVLTNPQFYHGGWMNFANMGIGVPKEAYQPFGFESIRVAVESVMKQRVEFRKGDISQNEAPLMVRYIEGKFYTATEENEAADPSLRNPQGCYMGEVIQEWAFYRPKERVKGWDAAANDLARQALKENWSYHPKDHLRLPILKNYLSYTFERLLLEDKLEEEAAEREGRVPRKKVLTNERHAVWNTGLVDKQSFRPIFAFYVKNEEVTEEITQPWIFMAYDTADSSMQMVMSEFPYQPERASYYTDPRELIYDVRANKPTVDLDHVLRDNIERLPLAFLKMGHDADFDFISRPYELPKKVREDYFRRLSQAINADPGWKFGLTARLDSAIKMALARVKLDPRRAIPVYYVKEHKLQLLLPLELVKPGVVDVALVCAHTYNEATGVNNYSGLTIFTLEMAYNNARLISRLDGHWLKTESSRPRPFAPKLVAEAEE